MPKLNRFFTALMVFLFLACTVAQVAAHTPLNPAEEIHSLETAFEVPNPTKSWTLYRELHHEGESEYYRLHLNVGERLRVSIYAKEIESNFAPYLIVMAENLPAEQSVPSLIEIPEGFKASVYEPTIPENREYEPFTPASYYYLINIDETIANEGDYYLVVYEPNSIEGKYGIAIGYKEEFTLSEWLLIPIDVINIHIWEGQSLAAILLPLLLSLIVGFSLFSWKSLVKPEFFNIVGLLSGLLYVGSGLIILMQMLLALSGAVFNMMVVVTFVFIAFPLVFGFILLNKAVRVNRNLSIRERVFFLVLGVVGLFTWSGLLLGPALAILGGIFPNRFLRKTQNKSNQSNST